MLDVYESLSLTTTTIALNGCHRSYKPAIDTLRGFWHFEIASLFVFSLTRLVGSLSLVHVFFLLPLFSRVSNDSSIFFNFFSDG